ncbi:MAG TPA: polysaccharide biosynthesis tyrosine autokinase [bacterium]|nr:polysaccharide biosynthesis tyrosine autokinase [bacterium]
MNEKQRQTADLGEVFRPLKIHGKGAIITFIAVITLTVIFLTVAKPVYQASASLSIQEGDLHGQIFDFPNVFFQKNLIKNQVAILQSHSLALDVIHRLQESPYADSLVILGAGNDQEKTEGIGNRLGIRKKEKQPSGPLTLQEAGADFQSQTKVIYGRDTDIVELRAVASRPWEAAVIVNAWIQAYQDYHRSDTQGQVNKTRMFLEEKLMEMEHQLAEAEARLTNFKKFHGVVSLNSETEQLVQRISEFETVYKQTKTDLEAVDTQLAFLKAQLDENQRSLVENVSRLSTPELSRLRNERAELMNRRAAFESQLIGAGLDTRQNVKLKEMDDRLNGINQRVIEETRKLVNSGMAGINPLSRSETLMEQILELETLQKSHLARRNELRLVLAEYTQRMESIPDKDRELAKLERDVQVNNKLYIMLREKYEEARIREAGQMNIIRVVDLAAPPGEAMFPKKKLTLLLAGFFGVLLAFGYAYGQEYLRDTVYDESDLFQFGIRVIGTVPTVSEKKRGKTKRSEKSKVNRARDIFSHLLTHRQGYSSIAEAYRVIRTSIYFTNNKLKNRAILITSAGASEGKSTTSANLAITFANKGVRTLLVDSDLRRPVLDMLFLGTQSKNGLTHHLGHALHWKEVIRETSVKNLFLMPAGALVKNASELLCSREMQLFIHEARKHFGIVILDSPPLLPVTDATVLASFVDGVVLVVRVNETKKQFIRRSLELLNSVDATILGAVLNGMDPKSYYGYHSYYMTYSDEIEAGK